MVTTQRHLQRCVDHQRHLKRILRKIGKTRLAIANLKKTVSPLQHHRSWIRMKLAYLKIYFRGMSFRREAMRAAFHTHYVRLGRRRRICVKSFEEMKQIYALSELVWDGDVYVATTNPADDLGKIWTVAIKNNINVVAGFRG
ncbi:hypothetical protein V6N13_094982 [Hibiscus sabdariffa]|uniref:Uncharacterized protein n=1 Tax=Hibiscus sabdariffa TaxID=183260 RepID=A0ABR2PSZ8_9ROSI